MTPFPAAKPSALITIGAPISSTYLIAALAELNRLKAAVGILCRKQNSFVKLLDPSSFAASALGPNALIPAMVSLSMRPPTNGASGPTTTKSIDSFVQNLTKLSRSSTCMGMH